VTKRGCGPEKNQEIKKGSTEENRLDYQLPFKERACPPFCLLWQYTWGLDPRERWKSSL